MPIPLDIILDLGTGERDESDWRPVPSTDRGNAAYTDRGEMGGYETNGGRPFDPPADVRWFTGYGADEAVLKRGWCEPLITEHPGYERSNYQDRYSQPRVSDVTKGNVEALTDDLEFRNRNRRSKGFLTHGRIPRERG